ncbi:MAG: hypothetical protein EBS23_00675 [Betaproteobacteria bacterium]|nr:hypothetical protein [Betaproteobacteria bacterium]
MGSIIDHLAAAERALARRATLYHRLETGMTAMPSRWQRTAPRASIQYAGAMTTEAARDPRLARGAVSLLLVLRARAGNGRRTDTTKTTLGHCLRVSTRTIGRWLQDLVRFGYVAARPRCGADGLYTGLILELAEKVLPCFRQLTWLSNWIAHNEAATGGIPDRTKVSDTNHFLKESSFVQPASAARRR